MIEGLSNKDLLGIDLDIKPKVLGLRSKFRNNEPTENVFSDENAAKTMGASYV